MCPMATPTEDIKYLKYMYLCYICDGWGGREVKNIYICTCVVGDVGGGVFRFGVR